MDLVRRRFIAEFRRAVSLAVVILVVVIRAEFLGGHAVQHAHGGQPGAVVSERQGGHVAHFPERPGNLDVVRRHGEGLFDERIADEFHPIATADADGGEFAVQRVPELRLDLDRDGVVRERLVRAGHDGATVRGWRANHPVLFCEREAHAGGGYRAIVIRARHFHFVGSCFGEGAGFALRRTAFAAVDRPCPDVFIGFRAVETGRRQYQRIVVVADHPLFVLHA